LASTSAPKNQLTIFSGIPIQCACLTANSFFLALLPPSAIIEKRISKPVQTGVLKKLKTGVIK